nr:hypothetical protein [uncultured Mediterranean phage uvMED]
MASFYNNKISTTYVSIIKSLDNAALTASLKELSDGSGNATGLFMNTGGDFKVTNILEWGTLKDTGENISITKFVDEADGIANNDNDTTIPTTAAIVDYVAARITLEDLDFRGDDSTVLGSVDLDSQTFAIVGTSNEIETSTSAGSQQLQIGLPNNVTISGNLQVNGLLKGNNNLVVKDTSDRTMAAFYGGNKVELYFNDSKKFETTSDGVTVSGGLTATGSSVFTSASFSGTITGNVTGDLTGNVTATSVLANGVTATTQSSSDNSTKVATTAYVDAQSALSDTLSEVLAIGNTTGGTSVSVSSGDNINFTDSSMAIFGTGSDLKIYHDGSTSYIKDVGTGNLQIETNDLIIKSPSATETLASFATNGAVELYFNDNKKLETTSDGATVTGGLTATGGSVFTGATFSSDVDWTDNAKARFGTGNDLEIYHDGSNSYISEGGTGNLYIQGSDSIYLQSTTGETLFRGISNNAAILFYDGNSKISTTTGGVLVEGIAVADGLDMGDNEKIRLGDSQDLEIYHDGSHSYIQDVGTGNLIIEGSADLILKATGSNNLIVCNANADVQLMHNGSEKLKTTTTGITVTGNVNSTGIELSDYMQLKADDAEIYWTNAANTDYWRWRRDASNNFILDHYNGSSTNNAISIDGSQDVSLAGSLTIAQNLTVNGTTTTINTSTIAVEDSMIEMAKDNAANSLDIGTYGKYNDGSARYLGLFSDASDSNVFKLFKNLTVQPTTTVDTSDASFALADFVAGKIGVGVNPSSRGIEVSGAGALGTLSVSDGTVETVLWGDASGTNLGGVGTNNNYGFNIYQNGGVAIEIDTSKNTIFKGTAKTQNTSASAYPYFAIEASAKEYHIGVGGASTATGYANNLYIYDNTASALRMVLDTNGRLGLGESTPTYALEVINSTYDNIAWGATSAVGVLTQQGSNPAFRTYGDLDILFYANNNLQLTIDDGLSTFAGNVTINKASNPTSLQIGSSLADDPFIVFQTDGNTMSMGIDRSDSNKFVISDNATLGTNNRLTIDTSGNSSFEGDVVMGKLTATKSGTAGVFNSGTTNVVASFTSTDGTGVIQLADSGGNVEIGAAGNDFVVQPAGGVAQLTVGASSSTFAGNVTVSTANADTVLGLVNTASGGVNWSILSSSGSSPYAQSSGDFLIRNASSNVLRLGNNGNATFAGDVTFGDSHFIGDDASDNLLIQSSANENIIIDSLDDLFFRNSGSTHLTVKSTGNVGIGTTSPSANTLQLTGKYLLLSDSQTKIGDNGIIGGGSADGNTRLEYYTGKSLLITQSGTERMRITSGGKTIVGTDSSNALEVHSSGDTEIGFSYATHGNVYSKIIGDITVASPLAGELAFQTASGGSLSERMRITSAGDVLLRGTYNPYTTSNRGNITMNGTASNIIAFTNGTAERVNMYADQTNFEINNVISGYIRFKTNNTERMRITSAGNVGIGTDSPDMNGWGANHTILGISTSTAGKSSQLNLRGNSNATADVMTGTIGFLDSSGTGAGATVGNITVKSDNNVSGRPGGYMGFYTNAGLNAAAPAVERMRILSGGDVLISKTASDYTSQGIELRDNGQLNVAGTVDEFNFYNTSAGAYRFFVNGAGTVFATSTSISAISDISLKENIKPLETGLEEVIKLQPRRFDWKNGDGKNIAGFVAQEVEEVLPDLVSDYKYNDKENKKSVKMGDMLPTLVNAIQELKAEIDELKKNCNCN